MTEVTAQEIKDAFYNLGGWPDWTNGRVWRVPVYRPMTGRFQEPDEVMGPVPIPVIEFNAEPAIDNETGRKVWLFYGRSGDLKILCEVAKR